LGIKVGHRDDLVQCFIVLVLPANQDVASMFLVHALTLDPTDCSLKASSATGSLLDVARTSIKLRVATVRQAKALESWAANRGRWVKAASSSWKPTVTRLGLEDEN
jgi:hypothetical protein